MPTASQKNIMQVGSFTISGTFSETNDSAQYLEVTLPVGVSGTLTTRTDDDTGVCTLGSGHGLTDSDTVDVWWSSGVRYGMSITAYDGTTITVDGGAGDNLPTQDTAVVATLQVEIDFPYDGDDIDAIIIECTQRAHLDFQESDTTSINAEELTVASDNGYYAAWFESSGVANPYTGDPMASIFASNSSSSTAATLKIGWLIDVTP